MQIRNINNASFGARNPRVRELDDFARKIRINLPYVSESRVNRMKNIDKFPVVEVGLKCKMEILKEKRSSKFYKAKEPFEKMLAFLNPIKKAKVANCGELTYASAVAAKMNGMQNFEVGQLATKNGGYLDHAVLVIRDKKPIIVDPWFGFADYVSNAMQKYSGEYRDSFKKIGNATAKDLNWESVEFESDDYVEFLSRITPKRTLQKLKKKFPEFLMKK